MLPRQGACANMVRTIPKNTDATHSFHPAAGVKHHTARGAKRLPIVIDVDAASLLTTRNPRAHTTTSARRGLCDVASHADAAVCQSFMGRDPPPL